MLGLLFICVQPKDLRDIRAKLPLEASKFSTISSMVLNIVILINKGDKVPLESRKKQV